MKLKHLVFLIVTLSPLLSGQTAFTQDTLGTLQEVEDHVFLFQGSSGWGLNSVVLEDEDGLILIDTQFEDENNKRLIEEIKRVLPGKKVNTIVVSHAHADHFMGIKFFFDAFGKCAVIGIKGEREHMEETARQFFPIYQQVSTEHGLTLDDVVYPDKEMATDFELTFSGRVVQFEIIEQNESWRSLIAYLPDSKLIYLADMYWGGLVVDPAVGASIIAWVEELRQVMERDIESVIPGHGAGVFERNTVDEFVEVMDGFVATSRKLIEQGLSKAAFLAHEFDPRVTWFGDKNAHLGHAYDEVKADIEKRKGGTR